LARKQNNVSKWSDMSTRGLLFQWASTIKIQLLKKNTKKKTKQNKQTNKKLLQYILEWTDNQNVISWLVAWHIFWDILWNCKCVDYADLAYKYN
jgi:hypothetical protein